VSATDDVIATFGYGSLVNRQTLQPGGNVRPGVLHGWVREWRIAGQTPAGRSCALTVRPHENGRIMGVLIEQSAAGLPDLDRREWRYDRHRIADDAFWYTGAENGAADAAFVYCAKREHYRWGDADHPIFLSYIDVVLNGYADVFGDDGVDHFVATTNGWQVPILNDRSAPRYPRAQPVSRARQRRFDAALAAIGARFL
jgi:cation transport protein ChaC